MTTTDESKEPVTREDLEKAKTAIMTVVADQNLITRAHIASEVETLRADSKNTKNFAERTLTAIKKLLSVFGIGPEGL